jgi:hypothetical protein
MGTVSTVSDYGLDDRGSIPRRGKRIFPLASVSRLHLGVHPASFPSAKVQPWCDADQSLPPSAEVKNE